MENDLYGVKTENAFLPYINEEINPVCKGYNKLARAGESMWLDIFQAVKKLFLQKAMG